VWLEGWKFNPEILLGGLASGLASTGTFEMVRNMINKEPTVSKEQLVNKEQIVDKE